MAAFIDAKSARIAFGLTWKRVQQKKERAETASLVRKHRATYKARWSTKDGLLIGVTRKTSAASEPKKKTAVLSGAALFASKVPPGENALLVFPVDAKRTRFALVAIVDGAPYLDVVEPSAQIRGRIESLHNEGHADVKEYGDHPELISPVEWSLDDLLGGNKQLALMTKTVDRRPLLIKVGIAIAAAGVSGGMYLYDYVQEQEAAAQELTTKVDPVADYRNSLNGLLRSAGLSGDVAYKSFWSPLGPRETRPKGWAIKKVTCNRTLCTEQWDRIGGAKDERLGGTIDDLIASLPKGATYSFPQGTMKADTVTVTRGAGVNPSPLEIRDFPAKAATWVALTSKSQRLQFDQEFIGENAVSFNPAPAAPYAVPAGVSASDVPKTLLVERGTFTFSGPLGLLQSALAHTLPNEAIDEVVIDASGEMEAAKFTIKGSYYVKN